MKSGKCLSLLAALTFGVFAASSFACDKDKKAASKPCSGHHAAVALASADGETGQPAEVKVGGTPCAHAAKAEKAPCSHSAKTVAEKAPCGHAAKAEKAPCGQSAQTVADKAPCAHAAKAEAGKAPCHHGAKTVSAEGSSPCGKGCSSPCKNCPHAQKAAAAGSGCCPKGKAKAILASLPAMQYRVGNETIGCANRAKSMAKSNGGSVEYVIGDEAFSSEDEAQAKLLSVIEEQVKTLQTVRYQVGEEYTGCAKSAEKAAAEKKAKLAYSVGGFNFDCKAKAEKVASRVKDAAEGVKLQYKVGDENFCCNKKANERSKETGKPVHFLVGDQELSCPTDAMKLFTEAKITAIVETAAGESAPVEAGS